MNEKHKYSYEQKLKFWGPGEWVDEPDEIDFEYGGMKCKILRIASPDGPINSDGYFHMFGGHLCGYVCIPKDHPYFGKKYDDIDLEVHYGLTYCGYLNDDDEYWIGFDCAHSSDYVPSIEKLKKDHHFNDLFPISEKLKKYSIFNPEYRNINFCISECKSMVDQIKGK